MSFFAVGTHRPLSLRLNRRHSPQPLAVEHLMLVRPRHGWTPPTESQSEITRRDDFAAGAGHQSGEDADVDVGLQEMHRAVRKHGVGPAGVEAVDFPVVRAIHGQCPKKAVPSGVAPRPTTGFARPRDRRTARRSGPLCVPARVAAGPRIRRSGSCSRCRHGCRPGAWWVDREDSLVMPPLVGGPPGGSIRPVRARPASTTLMPA